LGFDEFPLSVEPRSLLVAIVAVVFRDEDFEQRRKFPPAVVCVPLVVAVESLEVEPLEADGLVVERLEVVWLEAEWLLDVVVRWPPAYEFDFARIRQHVLPD
jgi:hypothetical protein